MFRRFLAAAVVFAAVVLSATAVLPAAAKTNTAIRTHKLIVAVKKTMAPAAEKKLAVLVLISEKGGAPAGAGHAQQAACCFSELQRPLPCQGSDRTPLHGQLSCELSNLRLGQSQTRGRPQ